MNGWREAKAAALDLVLADIDELLVRLGNAEAFTEELGESGLLVETRCYAGGLRTLRNDLQGRARELRRHADVDVLPVTLTTRNVRPERRIV